MNGYKKYQCGLTTRMMWLNGRRYVVGGIDSQRWSYATVQAQHNFYFSDIISNGHAS
jgi:hypothetical protein